MMFYHNFPVINWVKYFWLINHKHRL